MEGEQGLAKREAPTAELVEDRLIIWNPAEGSAIYKKGYFGKPVGISKPKTSDFDVPLTLDLIEGLYLLQKGEIKVVVGPKRRNVTAKQLKSRAKKTHERFVEKFAVYSDLRRKGYVATPGIKFGCDLSVYERGPGIDHAPFLVEVKTPNDSFDAPDIVRAGRLATTVKKRFVFAVFDHATGNIDYFSLKWWKA
ncbi:MAG: tRNA-intron lyase [Candidatus Brockarchaeota archaeon]|nr:tRNA-intron lyase [Candidatus Brockarchaeota archaeon]